MRDIDWIERKYELAELRRKFELMELRFNLLLIEVQLKRLVKYYNPNQPRAPRGQPDGGQWIAVGGSGGAFNSKPESVIQNQPDALGVSGDDINPYNKEPYKPKEEYKPDYWYKIGVKTWGASTAKDLESYNEWIEKIAKDNEIDSNLIRGVITNERITRLGAGYVEALPSALGESWTGFGTFGPAQLGTPSRRDMHLSILEALGYEGAIEGAGN